MSKKIALLSVIMAAVPILAAPREAASRPEFSRTTTASDSRDGGQLDFRRVTVVQPVRCCFMLVTLTTWRSWSPAMLPTFSSGVPSPLRGTNRLTMLFDVNGDGNADFTAPFIDGGVGEVSGLPFAVAWIINPRADSSSDSPLGTEKPTPSSLLFQLNADAFAFLFGDPYRTNRLGLAFASRDGSRRDRIPNRGWIRVVSRP